MSFDYSDYLRLIEIDRDVKALKSGQQETRSGQQEILNALRSLSQKFDTVNRRLDAITERMSKVEVEIAAMRKDNAPKPAIKLRPKSEAK